MIVDECADLSGDFRIEVLNWNGDPAIPGYCVDAVISDNLVSVKKSSDL
jgi:hypothetical protein